MLTAHDNVEIRTRDMTAAWRHVDIIAIFAMVTLTLTGFALVHSATRLMPQGSFLPRQVLFAIFGVGVCALTAAIDYRWYLRLWKWPYGVCVLLLAAVLPLGAEINGTKGWFHLGGFQFQPSEPGKIATIIALAAFLGRTNISNGLMRVVGALVVVGAPMGLILLQPDLGSALVYISIGAGMLLIGGIPGRYLLTLVVIGVLGVTAILQSDALEAYQRDRLTTFVKQQCAPRDDACFNVHQAQIAISSGGITGYGYGRGPQTRGRFVPVQESDFVFTVAGEELGFAGAATIIGVFALLLWRIWATALAAPDQEGRLICTGVLSMLIFHIFENIGMSMGIMPVTGIPLPFISYGGSSMITDFAAIGLVLNVHSRRWASA